MARSVLINVARRIDELTEKLKKILIWVILFTVLLSVFNAAIRKITGDSSNAWLELQQYCFSAVFLLGAGYILKKDEHVRIDIIYGALSSKIRRGLNGAAHLFFTLPLTVFISYLSFAFWLRSFLSEDQIGQITGVFSFFAILCEGLFNPLGWEVSPNAGGLALWYAKGLLPLGMFFLVLQTVSEIIKEFTATEKL